MLIIATAQIFAKQGIPVKKSLLMLSICKLLRKSLLKPFCSQKGKLLYRLPWHNKENKNHLDWDPSPNTLIGFSYSYSSWGQNSSLSTSWVFYKLSISYSPTFGMQISQSTCLWTKTQGSRKNNGLGILRLSCTSSFVINNCDLNLWFSTFLHVK